MSGGGAGPRSAIPARPRLAAALCAALAAAGCSGSGGSAGGGGEPPPAGPPGADGVFSAPNAWTERIDAAPLHPQSRAMIDRLVAQGGFGNGDALQVDFSIAVLEAGPSEPRAPFARAAGSYEPDCDAPATVPLPAGGAIEGQPGYDCDRAGGDCHLLVVSRSERVLHELYNADRLASGTVEALCAVAWDLDRTYGPLLRGDQCTSADAAGLPIAPLLFSADEIAAGAIEHAVRFILPNARMRAGAYVRPATHAGAPSGPADAVPYGSRLRLRADFPLGTLTPAGRVVAVALQRYGMILADGGTIALTARDDRFTTAKWAGVGFDSRSLVGRIGAADFEVVDTGPAIPLTYDCVRVP